MYKKCVLHVRSCFAEKKPTAFLLPSLSSDLKVPTPSGGNSFSNVRSFIIFRSGEGVTSFTKGNSANFSSEKW